MWSLERTLIDSAARTYEEISAILRPIQAEIAEFRRLCNTNDNVAGYRNTSAELDSLQLPMLI